jgi:hypothetical protein
MVSMQPVLKRTAHRSFHDIAA